MGKGQTVKNAKSKSPTGTSEGYIFGEEKEQKSVMNLGDLEVFTEIRRVDLETAYEDLFGDSINKRNEAKASELSEIRMKKEARKAKRKEAKANGEDMKLWDKLNPQIKMQSLDRYAPIEKSPLDYFSERESLNQNLTMDLIPIIGEMSDYNVFDKYGEATGLTEREAIENRKICTEILKNVADRWNDDFPQLPLVMASVHNDSWSTHGHFKCVPVANYEPSSNMGVSKAPGLYRALEQMGIEPDAKKVAIKEEVLEKPLTEKQLETMRIEAMYERMDLIIEEEMGKFGWKKEVKHATEKDLDKYIELADLHHKSELTEKKVDSLEVQLLDLEFETTKNATTLEQQNVQISANEKELRAKDEILKNYPEITDREEYEIDKKVVLNKVMVSPKDYERLEEDAKNLAPMTQKLAIANQRLDEEKEATDHERQLKEYYRRQDEAKSAELKRVKTENRELRKENKSLIEQLSTAWDNLKTYKNKVLEKFGFKEVEQFENKEASVEIRNFNAVELTIKEHEEIVENKPYESIKDFVLSDFTYALADDEHTYYDMERWLKKTNDQLENGSLEESIFFTDYSEFYNEYKVDIEGAVKSMKHKPVTDKDKATEAYKQTLMALKNEMEEECFDIPQHPIFSKEDIEKKIMDLNRPRDFEIE